MHIRGLMFDSARCLENRAYYRDVIAFAAQRGINTILWHFTDDQGCTLEFDSVPGIASPHAYSKSEMRELIAFAKSHGIDIIPEVASLGHSRYITRLPQYRHLDEIEHVFTGICPVSPETRDVLAKLIAETAELFPSPFLHVGLDEANIGHHPLTREALTTRSLTEIVADHINFMNGLVRKAGKQMMMWGDGLLRDRKIAPLLPRNIVICDWQYGANVTGETTQYFLDEGFPVVQCPALISHSQPTFPGDELAVSNLRTTLRQSDRKPTNGSDGRILGIIETIWQPERYMHDALWIGIDLACSAMRVGPEFSIEEISAEFARTFWGFTPNTNWIDGCRMLYRNIPQRPEWLAVLKMDLEKLPQASEVATKSKQWQQILSALSTAAADVRANQQSYTTFCLMVEVIAHLYRKAQLLQSGGDIPAGVARDLLAKERELVKQVSAVWDHERFADDPTKHTAARACFSDNNFLAVLQSQLPHTEQLLKTASSARPAKAAIEVKIPAAHVQVEV